MTPPWDCRLNNLCSLSVKVWRARILHIPAMVTQVLLDKGVLESRIVFLSLIAAPEGIHRICKKFPRMKVVTSEIDEGLNGSFQVVPGAHRMPP